MTGFGVAGFGVTGFGVTGFAVVLITGLPRKQKKKV